MNIFKFVSKILISGALVFGLSAGGIIFAAESGSKEELNFEFMPVAQEVKKPKAKAPAKAVKEVPPPVAAKEISQPPPPAPIKETGPQKFDTDKVAAALKAASEAAPKVTVKKAEPIAPQPIKPRPIKVEEKRVEAVKPVEAKKVVPQPIKVKEKRVEAVKPVEAKKAAVQKEVIGPTLATTQAVRPAEKSLGVINKWFGLETGVERMDVRAGPASQIMLNQGPRDIFSLDDCINTAVKNNISLQTAEKSVKLAEMRIMEARRNMLPTVTVVFEPYTGKVNERNYLGRKQYIEGKQPLFHGGELYFAVKQAGASLEITKNERNKTRNELVLQVKKAYYTLAKAGDNLMMQTELSGEVERIFQMVNDQYDSNVASRLELLNVSSQASQIKYQLVSADGDVSVAELILKQAMNVEPEVRVGIKPRLAFNRVKVGYEDLLKVALTNRPEMRINMLMIDYYIYGKRIATAKSLPKVDLMGSWGLAKEEYTPIDNAWGLTDPVIPTPGTNPYGSSPDQDLSQQWYAGVKTSVPFWGSTAEYSWTREQWTPVVSAYQGTEATTNSFKLKVLDNLAMYSEKQLAEIDFDKARQDFIKIKQDVTLEVKEQCFSYQKALIQLDTAASKVKYQENDLEFMKMKRGLDEAQDSNVIESMIKLSQEKFGYVQALTDCHTAIASINKAIGVEDYFKDE